jgi:hypothetical protein
MQYLLIIVCPKTGREVPTGVETNIVTFGDLPRGKSNFQCPACGDIHEWSAADAMLAHSRAGLISRREHADGEDIRFFTRIS